VTLSVSVLETDRVKLEFPLYVAWIFHEPVAW
jgi:hypothetical protein